MKRSWCLFVAFFLLSPVAAAEIFKCTDGKGTTKYQNFPCQIDSIGSKATAAPPKEEQPAKSVSSPISAPVSTAPASTPQPSTFQTAAANPSWLAPGEPAIGMTMNEVRANAGEPTSKEAGLDGEIWYYGVTSSGDKRTVRFDAAGRVAVIEMVE